MKMFRVILHFELDYGFVCFTNNFSIDLDLFFFLFTWRIEVIIDQASIK